MFRIICILLCVICSSNIFANETLSKPIRVIKANAHEGPVCVPSQHRLYFTTRPVFHSKFPRAYTSIRYLDFKKHTIHTFIKHSNMVNSMWLTNDKHHLLLAEQGSFSRLGGIAKLNLFNGHYETIVNRYHDLPFNSPNKVIETKGGIIYFTDPNYGFNQGFKPKPQLPNALYAFDTRTHQLRQLSIDFLMPHGLAANHHADTLFLGDTAAIDGKNAYNPHTSQSIYALSLVTPLKIQHIKKIIKPSDTPDGFLITPNNNLLIASKYGIRLYDQNGNLIDHQPIQGGAVNLTLCKNKYFITTNTAIYTVEIHRS